MRLLPAADRPDLADDARALYESAFPAAERLPTELVLSPAVPGSTRTPLLAVGPVPGADDGTEALLGLVVLVDLAPHPALLLEYLAVDGTHRGGGIGGRLLALLAEHADGRRVLAELEPPETSEQAGARARFYRRNGYSPAPWQGGYGMPGPDGDLVPLQLWETTDAGDPDDPRDLVRTLYTRAYGADGEPHLARVLAAAR